MHQYGRPVTSSERKDPRTHRVPVAEREKHTRDSLESGGGCRYRAGVFQSKQTV
jgi:hypothetical protein